MKLNKNMCALTSLVLPYRSILQIFVHILKGEKIINEAIAKEKEEQLKNPTATRTPAGSSGLHGAHSIPAASGSQVWPLN